MMMTPVIARPNRKVLVPSLSILIAVTVNIGLLLLIGALISNRRIELAQQPKLQPVDFVRPRPKPVPPRSEPMEAKTLVDASNVKQPPAQSQAVESRKPPLPRKPRQAKADKRTTPQAKLSDIAAPQLDIPAQGDGAAFPSVPGTDDRLTAPPAQWNTEKRPATSDATSADGDESGSSRSKLVVLSRTLPDYPPMARTRGIQGWVEMEISVTPSGRVGAAKVVASHPKQIFDEAALEAIKLWRFQPAYKDGQAVEQRARLVVKFKLKQR